VGIFHVFSTGQQTSREALETNTHRANDHASPLIKSGKKKYKNERSEQKRNICYGDNEVRGEGSEGQGKPFSQRHPAYERLGACAACNIINTVSQLHKMMRTGSLASRQRPHEVGHFLAAEGTGSESDNFAASASFGCETGKTARRSI